MILIFSTLGDYTTTLVCKWIEFFGEKFIRVNKEDFCEIEDLNISENIIKLKINGNLIFDFKDIKAVWYRRGGWFII